MADSQNQQGIYLSKQGKVFGPFTRGQIEQLRRTGDYLSYSFIWDPTVSPDWKPVHLPPSPPPPAAEVLPSRFARMDEGTITEVVTRPGMEQPARGQGQIADPSSVFQVICHNNRDAVGGLLIQPSLQGFTMITQESTSTLLPFGQGSKVWINLLDEQSGQTENFPGLIGRVVSQDGHWALQVFWEKPAALLDGRVTFAKFQA